MAMPLVINTMTQYLKTSVRSCFSRLTKPVIPKLDRTGDLECKLSDVVRSTRHDRVSCLAEWSESTFDNRILMSCTRLLKTLLKVYRPHFTCYFANSVRS